MPKGICKLYPEGDISLADDLKKITGMGLRATTEMVEQDGKKLLKVCAGRKRETAKLKQELGW